MTAPDGPALLDLNVLLALAWPNHQFHEIACDWFEREADAGWATCQLTECGFVRLSSNPRFSEHAVTAHEAMCLLTEMVRHPGHCYLEGRSLAGSEALPTVAPHVHGHRLVTDAWLLALARDAGAHLLTLDSRLARWSPLDGSVRALLG